jgi:hypothetical protein
LIVANKFDEFVLSEQERSKAAKGIAVDWEARKTEWLGHIETLFEQAGEFLRPYLDAHQISVRYRPVKLNEQHLGSYSAKEMLISIGTKTVKLEPVGTLIIGSRGRVDVVGPFGRAVLVLLDSEIKEVSQLIRISVSVGGKPPIPPPSKQASKVNWVWRIMARPPRQAIVELNRDTFYSLLLEVANG